MDALLKDLEDAVVDEVWNKYTDTYSKPTTEDAVQMLQNAIYKVIWNNETISEKIKECIKK